MVMLLDTRYRIMRVNRAMADFVQSSPHGMAGHPCYTLCHKQEAPVQCCPHVQLLKDGQEHTSEVFDAKTGKYHLVTVSPIRDSKGVMTGAVHIARDITERKRAEQRIERLNRTLEKRISAEVAHNREKDHLMIQQSRLAALGEMIGNIAHQWRQPLNAVGLIVQSLLDPFDNEGPDREQLAQSVGQAMEIIQHMSQTIDDFRGFFKPEKESCAFSLSDVIRKAVSLVEAGFRSNAVAVTLDLKEDVRIVGYPNEYAQVLLNLLHNAKDIAIERRIRNPWVKIRLRSKGGRSVVTVSDNAGGIPASVRDRIFEPYFSTREQGKGTGIGLYMSKSIIEKSMGGRLLARSRAGGAEFIIEV